MHFPGALTSWTQQSKIALPMQPTLPHNSRRCLLTSARQHSFLRTQHTKHCFQIACSEFHHIKQCRYSTWMPASMPRSISSSAVAFILFVLDVSPTQVIPSPSQPGEQRAHGAHYWQLDEGKGQQTPGDALPSRPLPPAGRHTQLSTHPAPGPLYCTTRVLSVGSG